MATVTVVPQQVAEAGLTAVYASGLSAADTFKVRNDGRVILHFKKTGAGACTVTVVTPGQVGGHAVADQTVVVPATTGDVLVGPFPREVYNDGNNDLSFTLSEVTGLSVAAFQI